MAFKLEAVLFDLDDTLHDDTLAYQSAAEEVARQVEAEHGIDALALKRAYIAQAQGFWKQLSAASLSEKLASIRGRLWESALAEVGLNDKDLAKRSASDYVRFRSRYFTPFPGVVDLLKALRARRLKLGIVTNGFSETHREKIAILQIGDYFDAIFIADEVGMVKPDPLLFAHACTRLNSSPSVSAMVGDRYDRDIRGALEAGLFTVWVNRDHTPLPRGAQAPDRIITSISEVQNALSL
ncbi:MAG: HAD family hydrolase [Candidatus Eremiobacteraeota bacterium]|nr:HAD family hydrolase [Candidatus Eremiobacteraeota bacterium]